MILCCGEALIDLIPEQGRDGFVPRCGGAALNTAIALAGLGAKAGLLTAMSRDRFGQQIDAALARAGVDRSLIVQCDRPTTLAFVHMDGAEAEYTFYDENSAGRMFPPGDLPPLPDHVRCLLLGGISLCHLPGAEAYETVARGAAGRLVMLDPNIRPGFIGDEVSYRDRLQRMMARAHIVKLSEADLAWMDPAMVPLRDKLATILAAGPALVLYTRGAKGAVAYLRDGREVEVAAQAVQVADTVGAGDAFNAGFLARLAHLDHLSPAAVGGIGSGTLRDCLEHGSAAAAVALSRFGTA